MARSPLASASSFTAVLLAGCGLVLDFDPPSPRGDASVVADSARSDAPDAVSSDSSFDVTLVDVAGFDASTDATPDPDTPSMPDARALDVGGFDVVILDTAPRDASADPSPDAPPDASFDSPASDAPFFDAPFFDAPFFDAPLVDIPAFDIPRVDVRSTGSRTVLVASCVDDTLLHVALANDTTGRVTPGPLHPVGLYSRALAASPFDALVWNTTDPTSKRQMFVVDRSSGTLTLLNEAMPLTSVFGGPDAAMVALRAPTSADWFVYSWDDGPGWTNIFGFIARPGGSFAETSGSPYPSPEISASGERSRSLAVLASGAELFATAPQLNAISRAAIDPATGSLSTPTLIMGICSSGEPRAIAAHPTRDYLYAACSTGELVGVDPGGTFSRTDTFITSDKEIVVTPAGRVVIVGRDGYVMIRSTLPTGEFTTGTSEISMSPMTFFAAAGSPNSEMVYVADNTSGITAIAADMGFVLATSPSVTGCAHVEDMVAVAAN